MIFLLLTAQPPPLYNNPYLEGKDVVLSGRLSGIRIKNGSSGRNPEAKYEKLQLILDDVLVSEDIDPQNKKLNKDEAPDGVICYCDEPFTGEDCLPKAGSRLVVRGRFHNLTSSTNPGQFDMAAYYRSRGIQGSLSKAVVTDSSAGHDGVAQALLVLRLRISRIFDRYLDDDTSGILRAMILGDKDYLGEDIKLLFENAGCAHLLVISGTHIGIIGVGIYRSLRRLTGSVHFGAATAIVLTLLYCEMTGRGISAQRAVIMFAICVLGDCLGRTYDLVTALALSAFICLCRNPFMIFDSAFLLSFSALAGMGLMWPQLDKILPRKKIVRMVGLCFSVAAFTLPVSLYFFCKYPVYSLCLNLLLLPFSGVLILSGMSLALGGLTPFAETVCPLCALLCKGTTGAYIFVCRFFVSLKGSVLVTGQPGTGEILLYYFLLGLVLSFLKAKASGKNSSKAAAASGLVMLLTLTVFFVLCPRQKGGFNFVMLDVGQGDGLLAYTKRDCIITDMGSSDEKDVGKYVALPALKALGIRKVNAVFVSHTDEDHINGLFGLLQRAADEGIKVGALVMTDNSLASEHGRELKDLALSKGIKVYRAGRGDEIRMGDMRIEVLWPKKGAMGEPNEMSMVCALYCGDVSLLLTGDMEGGAEEFLSEKLSDRRFMIYKAAHHGSRNSNGSELLSRIRPQLTLISCGVDNRYGHPHEEALERIKKTGSVIYVTAQSKAVAVHCEKGRTYVKCFGKK